MHIHHTPIAQQRGNKPPIVSKIAIIIESSIARFKALYNPSRKNATGITSHQQWKENDKNTESTWLERRKKNRSKSPRIHSSLLSLLGICFEHCGRIADKVEWNIRKSWKRLLKVKVKMTNSSPNGAGQMQLEPLRPLDDFLWGSARFNMPNVQDLEKWNNRIVQNLLYYQTNYLYASLAVVALFLLWNPSQTLTILSLLALVVGAYVVLFAVPSQRVTVAAQLLDLSRAVPPQSRHQVFAGTLAIAGLTLYFVGACMNAVLLVLVPIFVSLVHASLRMRNVNNKMSNLLYQRVRHTPMGWILQSIDRLAVQAEEASRDR